MTKLLALAGQTHIQLISSTKQKETEDICLQTAVWTKFSNA